MVIDKVVVLVNNYLIGSWGFGLMFLDDPDY